MTFSDMHETRTRLSKLKVRLNVRDMVPFTRAWDPRPVFQAPIRAAFAQMIVSGMGAKFC